MINTQLCFILNEDYISLVYKNQAEFQVVFELTFDKKNEIYVQEEINQKLIEHKVKDLPFDAVLVAWLGNNVSLVPSAIFDNKLLKEFYLSTFEELNPNHDLDFNRIPSCSIVAIYDIPKWLKSFFVVRFPTVVLQHQMTVNLKAMLEKNPYNLTASIFVFPNLLQIIFVEKGEVLFANTYSINHENDVVYYLSFCVQQLNLDISKAKLEICVNNLVNFTTFDKINDLIKKISLFDKFQLYNDNYLSFKNQQFCV